MINTIKDTIKDTNMITIWKPPSIKNRDTRCSTRCVKNWINFKSTVPIGHYCECTITNLTLFNSTRWQKVQL